jgi:hypothetical protein
MVVLWFSWGGSPAGEGSTGVARSGRCHPFKLFDMVTLFLDNLSQLFDGLLVIEKADKKFVK